MRFLLKNPSFSYLGKDARIMLVLPMGTMFYLQYSMDYLSNLRKVFSYFRSSVIVNFLCVLCIGMFTFLHRQQSSDADLFLILFICPSTFYSNLFPLPLVQHWNFATTDSCDYQFYFAINLMLK